MGSEEIGSSRAGQVVDVEDAKPVGNHEVVAHYTPSSEEEKALDTRINWKLDTTVLLILAICFIVRYVRLGSCSSFDIDIS